MEQSQVEPGDEKVSQGMIGARNRIAEGPLRDPAVEWILSRLNRLDHSRYQSPVQRMVVEIQAAGGQLSGERQGIPDQNQDKDDSVWGREIERL